MFRNYSVLSPLRYAKHGNESRPMADPNSVLQETCCCVWKKKASSSCPPVLRAPVTEEQTGLRLTRPKAAPKGATATGIMAATGVVKIYPRTSLVESKRPTMPAETTLNINTFLWPDPHNPLNHLPINFKSDSRFIRRVHYSGFVDDDIIENKLVFDIRWYHHFIVGAVSN